MNKKSLISLIVIILVLLGGLAYLKLYNIPINLINNTNTNIDIDNNQQNGDEIDTSDWVTFEDEVLGIGYKHPADCDQNWAGPGTNYTHLVRCYLDIMMSYYRITDSFPNYDNGRKLTTNELAEIYHDFNKNIQNENIAEDRILTDIKKIDINGNEAYQFVIDSAFYLPCTDDYTKSCDGGIISGVRKITFVETNDSKMLIKIRYSNVIEEKILSTFYFID